MKKRVFALVLAAILAVSTCGCKKVETSIEIKNVDVQAEEEEKAAVSASEESAEASVEEEAIPDNTEESVPEEMKDESADSEYRLPEELQCYEELLDHLCVFIGEQMEPGEDEGELGLAEAAFGSNPQELLRTTGFTARDINDDGQKELFIGNVGNKSGYYDDGTLFAVFGMDEAEQKPVLVVEGWSRSRWYLLTEDILYHEGSSGATRSVESSFCVGLTYGLGCLDFYFTWEDPEGSDQLKVYHNTTAEWDPEKAELTDMTEDDFFIYGEEMLEDRENLDYVPFAKLPAAKPYLDIDGAKVEWLVPGGPKVCTLFNADMDSDTKLVFSAPGNELKDFRFLRLEITDVDEDGRISYDTEELYYQEALGFDQPLVVNMTFYGDLPTYGYSYVDSKGEAHSFSLSISGEDGSIVTEECMGTGLRDHTPGSPSVNCG